MWSDLGKFWTVCSCTCICHNHDENIELIHKLTLASQLYFKLWGYILLLSLFLFFAYDVHSRKKTLLSLLVTYAVNVHGTKIVGMQIERVNYTDNLLHSVWLLNKYK